jgi:hypothetical protein
MAEAAVTNELLARREFNEVLRDPSYRIWLLWDGEEPVAMCVIATDIRHSRFLSTAYFEARYPTQLRNGTRRPPLNPRPVRLRRFPYRTRECIPVRARGRTERRRAPHPSLGVRAQSRTERASAHPSVHGRVQNARGAVPP